MLVSGEASKNKRQATITTGSWIDFFLGGWRTFDDDFGLHVCCAFWLKKGVGDVIALGMIVDVQ